jgi:hypothetical protein
MCGLVSIIARKPAGFNGRELDLMEQMLTLDTLRGKDSTGVMTMFRDKGVQVVKTATQPFLMFDTSQWGSFRQKTIGTGRFLCGHNRAATRGDVNNDNAHPFVENHIVLMHNGTLHYHGNLTKENVKVDSHAICHALAVDTPEVVVPKIKGAYALLWYNTETERMYAVRNDERPLHIIVTDDYYMLSSEAWIASIPAVRQGRKISTVLDVAPGTLYSWDLQGVMTEKVLEFPKSDTTHRYSGDAEAYQNWMAHRHGYTGPWNDDEWDEDGVFQRGETKDTTPPEIKNLRLALTNQAQEKVQKESSKDCVLTQPDGPGLTSRSEAQALTSTTPKDSASNKSGLTAEIDRIEAQQRNIITPSEMFKPGDRCMVKLWTINKLPNGRFKWSGKIMEPDKEMIDAQGFMPDNLSPAAQAAWLETYCMADVCWHSHTTNGGPSVFMRDVERCTYLDIHGTDIPSSLWTHAVNHCECGTCGAKIEQFERLYTHVRMKGQVGTPGHQAPLNVVAVKCPDCLANVLPEGEVREKFVKGYTKLRNDVYNARQKAAAKARQGKNTGGDSAVQGGQPVSPSSSGGSGGASVIPSTPTLH